MDSIKKKVRVTSAGTRIPRPIHSPRPMTSPPAMSSDLPRCSSPIHSSGLINGGTHEKSLKRQSSSRSSGRGLDPERIDRRSSSRHSLYSNRSKSRDDLPGRDHRSTSRASSNGRPLSRASSMGARSMSRASSRGHSPSSHRSRSPGMGRALGLSELVRCGLCGNSLTSPKTLQCFHSFCKACLQRLLTNDEAGPAAHGKAGSIVCPQCNHASQRVHIRNNQLLSLLAELHQDTGAELVGRKRCEYCDQADAEFRCLDCHTDLCAEDKTRHQRMPMLRDHRMAPLIGPGASLQAEEAGLVIDQQSVCPTHTPETLTLFCAQCEKLLCDECRGHETHKVESIEDSLTRIIPEVKDRIQEVDTAMLSLRANRRILRGKKDRFIGTVNDARNALEQMREEALARVERDYEDLKAQLEAQHSRSLLPCTALEQRLGLSLERVRGTLGWAAHTLSVARGTSLLQELLAALKHQLDQLDPPPTYKTEVEDLNLAALRLQAPGHNHDNVLGCVALEDKELLSEASPQEQSEKQAEASPAAPLHTSTPLPAKVVSDEEVNENHKLETDTKKVVIRSRSVTPVRENTHTQLTGNTLAKDRTGRSPYRNSSRTLDTEYLRTGYSNDWRGVGSFSTRRIDDHPMYDIHRVEPWREHAMDSSSLLYGAPRLARRLQYKTHEGHRFKIFCCGAVQSVGKVDERLWLPVPSENRIVVYSTSGTFCRTVAHPRIKSPRSVVADSYGNVLVAAASGLFMLRWSGELVSCIAAGDFSCTTVCGSSGAALEWVSGLLYQLVYQGRQWLRRGAVDLHLNSEPSTLCSEDTCLVTHDRIFVTGMSAGIVRRYTPQGIPAGVFQGVPFPRLCFADAEGSLVVADRAAHTLHVLGPDGEWYATEQEDYKPCHAVLIGGATLWVLGSAPGNMNLLYRYTI